jgi:hypothetical protein
MRASPPIPENIALYNHSGDQISQVDHLARLEIARFLHGDFAVIDIFRTRELLVSSPSRERELEANLAPQMVGL